MKRSQPFVTAAFIAFSGLLNAQPFTVLINGSIPGCAPNTMVEIFEDPGLLQDLVPIDANCTFTATVNVFQPTGTLVLVTTCANGSVATTSTSFEFQTPGDTIALSVVLTCGPDVVDCLGVIGGINFPGQPCDDGSASTLLDTWGADCQCAGIDSSLVYYDCLGIANGSSLPGTPCIQSDPINPFPIGTWNANCECVADTILWNYNDCLGILNGPNVTGTPCDDGNASTEIDLWDSNCECMGYDSSAVTFDCMGVPFGSATPGTLCILDDPNNPFPFGIWSSDCMCIPDTSVWNTTDCLGIVNGPNVTGSPCDDGNPNSAYDQWDAFCQCIGYDTTTVILDCEGVPFGNAMPGSQCFVQDPNSAFLFGTWSADCICVIDSVSAPLDCAGIPNGPNQPGTACFDPNNPMIVGYWDLNCVCVVDSMNGFVDCLGIPGGPNMPGLPCSLLPDSVNTVVGIWGADCVCYANTFDCLGIPGGGNLPGAPCQSIAPDGTVYEGIWGGDCFCYGDSTTFVLDCLGQPNGPNMPGTPCLVDPSFPVLPIGTWSADCLCVPDSSYFYTDCLGIDNGPNTVGSVCDTGDPNVLGYWNAACECEAYTPPPCTASFIVTPGIFPDSSGTDLLQLWIWNTSYGGTGVFTYLWDFGDGTTSIEPWPIHEYAGPGPYALCLTIADTDGCINTFCDTLDLDENGNFNGMQGGDNRDGGFSIQVMAGSPTSVSEARPIPSLELWPNPATDLISYRISTSRDLEVSVVDMNGRMITSLSKTVSAGNNIFTMPVEHLESGIYVVRISDGMTTVSRRFVKN